MDMHCSVGILPPPASLLQAHPSIYPSMGRSSCIHSELPTPSRASGVHMTAISNMSAWWMNPKCLSFTGVMHNDRSKTEKSADYPNLPFHSISSLNLFTAPAPLTSPSNVSWNTQQLRSNPRYSWALLQHLSRLRSCLVHTICRLDQSTNNCNITLGNMPASVTQHLNRTLPGLCFQ